MTQRHMVFKLFMFSIILFLSTLIGRYQFILMSSWLNMQKWDLYNVQMTYFWLNLYKLIKKNAEHVD